MASSFETSSMFINIYVPPKVLSKCLLIHWFDLSKIHDVYFLWDDCSVTPSYMVLQSQSLENFTVQIFKLKKYYAVIERRKEDLEHANFYCGSQLL